jgi:photosystem II stability/assembly factor-like uncharacterized protein
MQLPTFSRRPLIGAAALACAAALIPAALAATTAPAATSKAATVPPGFQPASASFLSPAMGFVLGAVGCKPQQACAARLVATTDGGARWRFLKTPDVRLPDPAAASQAAEVSGVVFARPRTGWLYGPGLYSTRDGGAHWRRLFLGGSIDTVAASAGTVYAVVSPPGGRPDELFRSPVGKDAWARAGTMAGEQAILAVSGRAAWFGTSTDLWATADGAHWHKYPYRCPGAYYRLTGIAAASGSQVVLLCTSAGGMFHTDKEVLRSVDGGRSEHLTGHAPAGGDDPYGGNGGIAVPPHPSTVITIAAYTPGPDYLYRSANGGKTWANVEAPGTEGGVNLSCLSYVSPTVGWVVTGGPGDGSQDQLLRTSDAGGAWHKVGF